MMKRMLILALLITVLAGCEPSGQHNPKTSSNTVPITSSVPLPPTSTPVATSSVTSSPLPTLNKESVDAPSPLQLKSLTKKDAGLHSIDKIDFSKRKLQPRIADLLSHRSSYVDKDFADGIYVSKYADVIIATERYKDTIVEGLKIGDDLELVKRVFSTPSFQKQDYIFYKTNQVYVGFKGTKTIEQVIFHNPPEDYNKDVLKNILSNLAGTEKQSLSTMLQHNSPLSSFFEKMGHINGGGYYANALNGIEVSDFSKDSEISIYNNFEGDLYTFADNDNRYKFKFKDEDLIMTHMMMQSNEYINTNVRFKQQGEVSPSGKYAFIYDWIYSMSQYFTIRTLDLSKPDFRLSENAMEYKWLSDDYIVCIHAWAEMPYIVKVSDQKPGLSETINVLYQLKMIKKNDYPIGEFHYRIKEVTNNKMKLVDERNHTVLDIDYRFDSKKNFILNQSIDGK